MKNTYETVKQEFIKKWIKTLQEFNSCDKQPTNITETKNAIKLTSDIAIAAVRGGSTLWSRSLVSRTTKNKPMARRILRKAQNRRKMKKKMRNRCLSRRNGKLMALKKLKSLVPGGELMDDKDCLLRETFDYIVYLRVQVDAMRTVSAAVAVAGNL